MSKTVSVTVRGNYRDAETTVRAVVRGDYLIINRRQISAAADRCCYAGADYPRFDSVGGYGDWGPMSDDSLRAHRA